MLEIAIKVPDEIIADIRDKLIPLEKTGMLHAVAMDALLGYFHRIRTHMKAEQTAT